MSSEPMNVADAFARLVVGGGFLRLQSADTEWGPPRPLSWVHVRETLRSHMETQLRFDDGYQGYTKLLVHGPGGDPVEFEVQVVGFVRDTDAFTLSFSDRSTVESTAEFTEARDQGLKLHEPLLHDEVRAIEPLVAELWAALEGDQLSSVHRAQIVAMAELIMAERLASVPGETPRWKLVGTVRAALRYLARDVPKDALAWWKLIELLEKINWSTIAGELPGL